MQSYSGATNALTTTSAPESQNANLPAPCIDLSEPGQRKLLARRIKDDIDRFCADKYDDGPRSHLGASLIGGECSRHLWYTFRWIKHKKHSGRLQRLFNRGHREEARFVEWLRGIGFDVWEFDPDSEADAKGEKQFRVKAVRGHFGGSLDGICRYPDGYQIGEPMLLEFKTQGTGPKFAALCKNGVQLEKPQHFAQMSTYGRKYGLRFALYMAINKNDDDIHVEIIELNWQLGEQLEFKAEMIINSQTPPPKIAQSAAYKECKHCDHLGVCFNDEMPARNCRSCLNAFPVDNAEWFCKTHNATIPKEALHGNYECWVDITKEPPKAIEGEVVKEIPAKTFVINP